MEEKKEGVILGDIVTMLYWPRAKLSIHKATVKVEYDFNYFGILQSA
jgi:hypothetical protein